MGVVTWGSFWSIVKSWVQEAQAIDAKRIVLDEAPLEEEARKAFARTDQIGGGFVQPEQVLALLREMGVPEALAPPSGETAEARTKREKALGDLERAVKSKA